MIIKEKINVKSHGTICYGHRYGNWEVKFVRKIKSVTEPNLIRAIFIVSGVQLSNWGQIKLRK